MKNCIQLSLFTLLSLVCAIQLVAQESTLNPDFLIFNTTPPSTQGSIYGLNGVSIQNGFNVGTYNSTVAQVGNDLLFSTLNGNGLTIQQSAVNPSKNTVLSLDRLTFKAIGQGQALEEWKFGRDIDDFNNPTSNFLTISRENTGINGGISFAVAVYVAPTTLNVGIGIPPSPNCKLEVGGSIHTSGNFRTSDARFKNNIRTIKKPMEKLLELRGVSYDYKTEEFEARNFPKTKQLGLVAQELESIFPELVENFSEGYKAINYDGLIPVLIEALKEVHKEKEMQNEEIETLKNSLMNMQTDMQELKQLLTKLSQNPQKATNSTITLSDAQLFQNAPNPFSKNTSIQYFIPQNIKNASLNISNMNGQLMKSIPIDYRGKGEILLEAYSLSSGQYVYSLNLDGKVLESRTMVLTK